MTEQLKEEKVYTESEMKELIRKVTDTITEEVAMKSAYRACALTLEEFAKTILNAKIDAEPAAARIGAEVMVRKIANIAFNQAAAFKKMSDED